MTAPVSYTHLYGKLKKYGTTYELDKNNILISLNGTTTGITNITTDEAAKNAPVYNLAGQKVTQAYKGVVIKNLTPPVQNALVPLLTLQVSQ